MWPFRGPEAHRLWSKACNYHRGSARGHVCGNPDACKRTLGLAFHAARHYAEENREIECQEIGIYNIDYWEGWQEGLR